MSQYEFINMDDNVYVTGNSHIQSGITLEGIRWAFSTTNAQFWHPLTWLSLMFDYQVHGLNAGGYHLTNVILHILSALLLFGLFNRMTGDIWKSAFVAALFALHPLHVESVAWIAKRKDVLSAFFWMLTLYLYVYYTEKPVVKRYLLVLAGFVLALMSKPMVITLPVMMILLDYWPLGRFESRKGSWVLWQLREKTPFVILSVIFSIIAFFVHGEPYPEHFSLSSRIANAFVSFAAYLEKTFWPFDLAAYYPYAMGLPGWKVLGAVFLIVAVSISVIAAAKRLPYLLVGWLWYGITILPVIGIIQVNAQAMSDHYTYLPLIGIGIMLAWGVPLLFPSGESRKMILFPAGAALLAVLSVLTWQQGGYWKNSISLFSRVLQVTRDNHVAHTALGAALQDQGRIQEAIDHYNEAIRIKPNYAEAYFSRGNAYDKLGNYQLAIGDYGEAIRHQSDHVYAYCNRGMVYFRHGDNKSGCRDAKKACELGNCEILKIARDNGHCF